MLKSNHLAFLLNMRNAHHIASINHNAVCSDSRTNTILQFIIFY